MLTPTACLNHSLRVLFHEWPTRAQLEHYLTNPLLLARYPKKVAATREALGGYTDRGCLPVLLRMKALRDQVRHGFPVPADALPPRHLTNLLEHDLISPAERLRLRQKAWHPAERQWEYERLEAVLKAREVAEYEREEVAQQEYEDAA